MRKGTFFVLLAAIVWAWCLSVSGSLRQHQAGRPVFQNPQYPEGLADLLNSGGRVYGLAYNFNETFYFAGDAQDFNRFLEGYSKLKEIDPVLTLHAGRGETSPHFGGGKIPFDWVISVLAYLRDGKRFCSASLSAWVGGQIELRRLKVPENIKLQGGGNEEVVKFIAAHEARRATPPDKGTEKPPPGDRHESLEIRTFATERPLFGKLALTEDGSRVLCVALDESKGIRTGYDVLWADVDFDGKFDKEERFPAGAVKRNGTWLASSSFPPIHLAVPYNEKAEGARDPCQVTLGYRQYPRHGVAEEIFVRIAIRQHQDSALWEHSFNGNVVPSRNLEAVSIWTFGQEPKLQVSPRPDGYRKGNLGIGLTLSAGENTLQCQKDGQPVKARVKITTPDGEVVHQGEATLDRFTFG